MIAPRCWPAVVVVVSWVSLTPAEEFAGKVVGVSDGDTITVLRNRTPIKVRLHGIDCPEIGQDFGSRAKAFTSECLRSGREGRASRHNRYRRTVADVILADGRILNHELVRAGLVGTGRCSGYRYARRTRSSRARCETRPVVAAEPVPPWEWRKTKGEAQPGEFIGNRRTHVYHKPGCPNAASISPGNRMPFNSAGAAEAAGFRPGKDCLTGDGSLVGVVEALIALAPCPVYAAHGRRSMHRGSSFLGLFTSFPTGWADNQSSGSGASSRTRASVRRCSSGSSHRA